MRRLFTALTAAFAVVAFSSMVLAQTPPAAAEKKAPAVEKAAKTEAAPAAQAEKAPAAKTEKKAATKAAPAAAGKVAKYDDATKTLTVTTKKGDENFMVTADTKIMAGAKAATTTDLAAGKNVKVNYTEADGKMTATKVTIAGEKAAKKEAAPKKEEKK